MLKARVVSKPVFLFNLIVLVLFGLAMGDVIFGFTNPTSDPPNPPGVLRAVNDEAAIGVAPVSGSKLTIAGKLNLQDNEIINIQWPSASTSVASRGYVDAAGGGAPEAGAVTTVTLFSISSTQLTVDTSNLFRGPSGLVPSGCHNNPGPCLWIVQNLWGALSKAFLSTIPGAGDGVPLCTSLPAPTVPAGKWVWFEIMRGYGPHETIINNYSVGTVGPFTGQFPTSNSGGNVFTFQIENVGTDGNLDLQDTDVALSSVSVTDSVCSYEVEANVSIRNNVFGGQSVVGAGINSACSPFKCNTCRICGLYKTP